MAAARAAYVAGFATHLQPRGPAAVRRPDRRAPARTASRCCTTPRRTRSAPRSSSLGARHHAAGRHLRHRRGGPARRRGRRPGARRGPPRLRRPRRARPRRCARSSTRSARTGTRIVVTSDLDEYAIAALAAAPVDGYGVGTQLVTGSGHPTCGFVYKLVAREDDDGRPGVGGEEERRQDLGRRPQVRAAPARRRRRRRGRGGRHRHAARRRRRRPARCSSRWSGTARSWAASRSTPPATGTPRPAPSCRRPPSRCPAASRSSRPSSKESTDMALVTCDFFSESLEVGTSMTVVLPQATEEQIGVDRPRSRDGPPPVLYLLHGLSDDHTAWLRYTSIERYAAAARPRGRDAGGGPQLLRRRGARPRATGPSSPRSCRGWSASSSGSRRSREDTFVAGLSMGGYGALKLAPAPTPSGSPRPPACPAPSTWRALAKRPERDELVRPGLRRQAAARATTCSRCSPQPTPDAAAALRLLRHRGPAARRRHQRFAAGRDGRRRRRHHRLPARRPRVGALGRRDPGRHRLAARLSSLASAA